MSDNFELQPTELPKDTPQTGQYLKNLKEMKIGNGAFYITSEGKLEIRDSNGNIVILLDPNG